MPLPSPPTPGSLSFSALRSRRLEIDDDPLALFEQSLREGWGDGLPLLPATEPRVLELAAAASLPLGHIVALLPPNRGEATVEKLAVNAAMAGVAPEAFPYVIAAIRAVAQPDHNLVGLTTTTSSAISALVVNGPRRRELGFDFDSGCLGGAAGRGSMTVGRAVQLALRNIGGMRVGATSKSVFGQPARVTGLCFAEWEERSPWPTLAEQHGFALADEVVHAHASKGTHAFADGNTTDALALVRLIAKSVATPLGNAFHGPPTRGQTMLLVNPMWAERLGHEFPDVRDLQASLLEQAWMPIEAWPTEAIELLDSKGRIGAGGRVFMHERPDQFLVVVCGGLGNLHLVALPTWGETTMQNAVVER